MTISDKKSPETYKNKRCWECEIETEEIEHHHPVPRSRGGTKTIPLCSVCHSKAHHRKKNVSISKLSKEGLARKMATGWKAGNPDLARVRAIGHATLSRRRKAFANKMKPALESLVEEGFKSYNSIATALNERGYKAARGGVFRHTSVKPMLDELGIELPPLNGKREGS